jgi:hypothetical protein
MVQQVSLHANKIDLPTSIGIYHIRPVSHVDVLFDDPLGGKLIESYNN